MAKKKQKVINFLDLVRHDGIDSDRDGLSDREERLLGTNPYSRDTDSDGLSDFEEVRIYGTNPLDSDTDKDGMSDGDEVRQGRNPNGPGSLHDYFIPHAGNDYEPHALRHHRLAFHAASAIAIKLVMVMFLVSYPMEAWLTPDVSVATSQEIVSLTNKIRRENSLPEYKISSKLNQSAVAKAQDMLIEQYFEHISPGGKKIGDWLSQFGYKYSIAGENLALGFTDASKVIEAWKKSPTHYANLVDTDYKEIGVGVVDGWYAGNETMLMVQHFGVPKIETPVAIAKLPTIEPVKNIKPIKKEMVIAKKTVVAKLAKPKLVFPTDGYLSKEDKVNLRINADKADKVEVFVDGEKMVERNIGSSSLSVIVPIQMEQGEHEIMLASVRSSEKSYSIPSNITVNSMSPLVDNGKTQVIVGRLSDTSSVVNAVAFLSPDTQRASLVFSDYSVELHSEPDNANKWVGRGIFFAKEEEKIFNPIVMPSLVTTSVAGATAAVDVDWGNVSAYKSTAWDRYSFLKKYRPAGANMLFSLATNYFWVILVLAMFSLVLNIFISIKRQHPRLILSSVGLVGILAMLILL